jgi:hypothetical protein
MAATQEDKDRAVAEIIRAARVLVRSLIALRDFNDVRIEKDRIKLLDAIGDYELTL